MATQELAENKDIDNLYATFLVISKAFFHSMNQKKRGKVSRIKGI